MKIVVAPDKFKGSLRAAQVAAAIAAGLRSGLARAGRPGAEVVTIDELLPAFERAKELTAEYRLPVVVEVILERVTNVSMGTEIDNVVEFEELALAGQDAPTAIALLD